MAPDKLEALVARAVTRATSGFACMECGHKFRTVKAAERASFGPNGCPKCGGSDIDLAVDRAKVLESASKGGW